MQRNGCFFFWFISALLSLFLVFVYSLQISLSSFENFITVPDQWCVIWRSHNGSSALWLLFHWPDSGRGISVSLFLRFSFVIYFSLIMSYAMAVQGNRTTQIEPTDPLYIHPFDNPAQPLVTNFFNGENFDNWKRYVTIALSARHKLAFIDGSLDMPESSSPLYILRQRNNAMVLSWLLNSLSGHC